MVVSHSYSLWSCNFAAGLFLLCWKALGKTIFQLEHTDMISNSPSLLLSLAAAFLTASSLKCECVCFVEGENACTPEYDLKERRLRRAQPWSIIGICSWMWRVSNAYPLKPFLFLMGKEHMDTCISASAMDSQSKAALLFTNINVAMQNFSYNTIKTLIFSSIAYVHSWVY